MKSNAVLPVLRQFDDGSYLSELVASRDHSRRADPITVRVVEYTLGQDETVYRLVTTSARPELAALYTHQGGPNFIVVRRHVTSQAAFSPSTPETITGPHL